MKSLSFPALPTFYCRFCAPTPVVQLLIHRHADVNHRGYGGAAAPLTCLAVPADGALVTGWDRVVDLMVKWDFMGHPRIY